MTMFVPRAQGLFDLSAARIINDEGLVLIEEHRDYLRTIHADQRRAVSSIVLSPWAPSNTLSGGMWLRELGFAKLALLNRGVVLNDHWEAIKRERDIPLQTLAWEVGESEFAGTSLNWGSIFYRYVMVSEQDRTTVALNGGRWIFQPAADVPGFSLIPNQEAMYFYGHIGGDIPHFHHIQVTPPYRGVTMLGGAKHTVQFNSEGGEPPIVWSVAGPEWMTVSDRGLVTLAPPGTEHPTQIFAAVTAKGQQEVEGHASLNVEILPIID